MDFLEVLNNHGHTNTVDVHGIHKFVLIDCKTVTAAADYILGGSKTEQFQ